MRTVAANFIPTRKSLLSRLRHWDDQDGWQEFFEIYGRLIYGVALKSGLTPMEADEVVQETVVYVAKKMPDFKYNASRGSFKGWLLQLTRWRIADQLRHRQPALSPPANGQDKRPEEELSYEPFSSELWDQEWRHNLLQAALERIKRQVSPKTFQIFDLYVVQGWPVGRIRELLGVSIGRIYITKHRVSSLLKKQMRLLDQNNF